MKPATVAIVGRPNVGKSTLFNRIVGARRAIVEPTPGVTRDRNYAPALWQGRTFQLVDTGGWEVNSTDRLQDQIRQAAQRAVSEADLVIFLLDSREGLNPIDPEIYNYLRGSGRPTLVVVNKIDSHKAQETLPEFYRLGAPEIFPVSAEHGTSIGELLDEIVRQLPAQDEGEGEPEAAEENRLRVAIIGRPNVGKSTLVNRIVGDERMIVDDRPGTTRDPIDIQARLRRGDQTLDLSLIDLAGIRRPSRISEPIEHYSVTHSLKAVRRSEVALLVLDAGESIEVSEGKIIVKLLAQEARLAEFVYDRGRGLILVVNKWDLVRKKNIEVQEILGGIRDRDRWLDLADLAMISALTGEGMDTLIGYLFKYREVLKKISTAVLNRTIQRAIERHHPPAFRGREIRVYYATQVQNLPQIFVIFTNHPQGITDDYQRYLTNVIREELGLKGIPVKLKFRKKT